MRLDEIVRYVHNLGPSGFARYSARRVIGGWARSKAPYRLHSRHTRYPLWCRPGTSDLQMFAEILCHRAFRCFDRIARARLILDCGANVGYSSAYFLTRYQQAKVIAIEPDPENFEMLERNLSPYAGRWVALRSAIWSQPAGLVMAEDGLGVGRECARSVRPARADEQATIAAVDIGTLLKHSGFERISILKIDIEGAERVVFESNYSKWLRCVDNLVIELHGEECARTFRRAIAGEGFEVSSCDEQTVCMRPRRTASSEAA